MARYDKYEPCTGGFRASIATDFFEGAANAADPTNPSNWNKVFAAAMNADGTLVVPQASVNGGADLGDISAKKICGVYIVNFFKQATNVIDVMTDGEITDFDDGKYAGVTAAQDWFIDKATGLLTHTAPAAGANAWYVGHTVEPRRLVVRFEHGAVVGA